MDAADLCDRLQDVASELTIITAAVNDLHAWSTEGHGLYLMLTRQIEQINAVRAALPLPPGD